MVWKAQRVGCLFDQSVLRLHPAADGMQHDEVAAGFGPFTKLTGYTWKKGIREIPNPRTTVDESIGACFRYSEVLQYDVRKPYRPPTLQTHEDFRQYYTQDKPTETLATTTKEDRSVPPPTREQPE